MIFYLTVIIFIAYVEISAFVVQSYLEQPFRKSSFHHLFPNEQDYFFGADRMNDWIRSNGGFVGDIQVHYTMDDSLRSCEREIRANRIIHAGDVVLKVPRSCTITKLIGEKTIIGQQLVLKNKLLHNHGSYLALALLEEREKAKSGYSDVNENIFLNLPSITQLKHLPLFWDTEELLELQGSPILSLLKERRQKISDDFNTLCEVSPTFRDTVSSLEFSWLYSAIMSRTFGFNSHSPKYAASLLVPLADMLNDNVFPELHWEWDSDLDMFTLRAVTDIEPDMPLHIYYGYTPNYVRLFNYGYLLNSDDVMEESGWQRPDEFSQQTQIELSLDKLRERADQYRLEQHQNNAALHPSESSLEEASRDDISDLADFISRAWDALHSSTEASSAGPDKAAGTEVRAHEPQSATCQLSPGDVEGLLSILSIIRTSVMTPRDLQVVRSNNRLAVAATGADECSQVQVEVHVVDDGDTDTNRKEGIGGDFYPDSMNTLSANSIARSCISLENECLAVRVFADTLLESLGAYTTTLEDDLALQAQCTGDGAGAPLSYNKKNAMQCRLGEKRVLHCCLDVLRDALTTLEALLDEVAGEETRGEEQGTPVDPGPQYSMSGPQYSKSGPQYSKSGPQYSKSGPQYSKSGPQYSVHMHRRRLSYDEGLAARLSVPLTAC